MSNSTLVHNLRVVELNSDSECIAMKNWCSKWRYVYNPHNGDIFEVVAEEQNIQCKSNVLQSKRGADVLEYLYGNNAPTGETLRSYVQERFGQGYYEVRNNPHLYIPEVVMMSTDLSAYSKLLDVNLNTKYNLVKRM